MALQNELERHLEVLATTLETLNRALADLVGASVEGNTATLNTSGGPVMQTLGQVTDMANDVCDRASRIATIIAERGEVEAKAAAIEREYAMSTRSH